MRSYILAVLLASCGSAAPEPQPATVVYLPAVPSQQREPPGEPVSEGPVPSAATTSESSGSAIAEASFMQGRQLLQEGRYAEACARFEESIEHDPAVGSYMNLGRCRQLEGNVPAACQAYEDARRRLPPTGDRTQFVLQTMQSLGCRVEL